MRFATCLIVLLSFSVTAHAGNRDLGAASGAACDIKDRVPEVLLKSTGSSVMNTIKAFNALKVKDDFETTAAYKARHAKEVAGIADAKQCLVVTPSNYGGTYDADHGRLMVGLPTFGLPVEGKSTIHFVATTKVISDTTYTGSNAFGVSKTISKSESEDYGVAFDEGAFANALAKMGAKKDRELGMSALFSVPMQADKAKAVGLSNIHIVVVYNWVNDAILKDLYYNQPTISDPREIRTSSQYLKGKLLRVIIFDAKSGEVFLNKSVAG